eukprot:8531580-Pyramimonas_sp.AAC.1
MGSSRLPRRSCDESILFIVAVRVGVKRCVGVERATSESFKVISAVVVALFDYFGCPAWPDANLASVGSDVCCSVSGELSVGNSGIEGGTRPRSIEGGGARSSLMIAARLERGRARPSPRRVGSYCSQYCR